MSLAPGGRIRGLLLAASLLAVLPLSPPTQAQAARAPAGPYGEASPPTRAAPAGLLPSPPTAAVAEEGDATRETPPGPDSFPAGAPPGAGGLPAARAKAPDDASHAPARDSATGEEAIQAVPFLVGSGLILLAVVLVFRRTLHTDRLLEKARRSRPPRPAGPRGRTGAAHDAERPSQDTAPPAEAERRIHE
ncbi:hypothetical protein GCM10017673_24400 [Streptosporangium violaceochromogenes]|nr:hypothetical protein GCM10017673_24400 [Streptosporangium violaceochromogenes]